MLHEPSSSSGAHGTYYYPLAAEQRQLLAEHGVSLPTSRGAGGLDLSSVDWNDVLTKFGKIAETGKILADLLRQQFGKSA